MRNFNYFQARNRGLFGNRNALLFYSQRAANQCIVANPRLTWCNLKKGRLYATEICLAVVFYCCCVCTP
jgi:hypothetical protein